MQIPDNIKEKIFNQVLSDLLPSPVVVYGKTGISIIIGGIASMFCCAQFGVGFSSIAHFSYHKVHHGMGPIWCALICGTIFSLLPVIILRFLTNSVQFRAIIRHKWQPQLIWLVLAAALLSLHGTIGFQILISAIWSGAAFFSYRLLGTAVDYCSSFLIFQSTRS